MKIYEKIFDRLDELHMSQMELSRRTGIATSTISDWRKKKINPQADKIVSICRALDMSLVDLLCDEETVEPAAQIDCLTNENYMIELFRQSDAESKRRIISYIELLEVCKQINNACQSRKRQRNVSIIQDIDGNNIVVINDIRFKGKRSINWREVRAYLKEYVGDFYMVASTGDVIYIGADLSNEYSGSKYTHSLKGTNAKAKANATQGIPEMIEIALGKYYRENKESKHWRNARYGWYNIFHASLIVRYSEDNRMYLYDIIDIKKETSNSLEP